MNIAVLMLHALNLETVTFVRVHYVFDTLVLGFQVLTASNNPGLVLLVGPQQTQHQLASGGGMHKMPADLKLSSSWPLAWVHRMPICVDACLLTGGIYVGDCLWFSGAQRTRERITKHK